MKFEEREITSRTATAIGPKVEAPLCATLRACLETLSRSLEENSFHIRKRRTVWASASLPLPIITRSANLGFSSSCLGGPDNLFTVLQLWPPLSRSQQGKWPDTGTGPSSTNLLLNSAVQEPHRSCYIPDSWLISQIGWRTLPSRCHASNFASCICRHTTIEDTLNLSLYCFRFVISQLRALETIQTHSEIAF